MSALTDVVERLVVVEQELAGLRASVDRANARSAEGSRVLGGLVDAQTVLADRVDALNDVVADLGHALDRDALIGRRS